MYFLLQSPVRGSIVHFLLPAMICGEILYWDLLLFKIRENKVSGFIHWEKIHTSKYSMMVDYDYCTLCETQLRCNLALFILKKDSAEYVNYIQLQYITPPPALIFSNYHWGIVIFAQCTHKIVFSFSFTYALSCRLSLCISAQGA